MSLIEHTTVTLVVLSIVALHFLTLAVVVASLSAIGLNQNSADILFLVLILLDGVVPSREFGAEFVVALHHLADVAGGGLGTVVVQVVGCKV
jgi:hypothetical protein